jgi:hypothetical protein
MTMTKKKRNQEIGTEGQAAETAEVSTPFSLEELRTDMATRKLIDYELLPYIDLYMDQVITLMSEQNKDERHRIPLTPSMINNYTKQGVLPRAHGKRYTRDHLVDLTLLIYLKEVLPIANIGELRQLLAEAGDPAWRYQNISEALDRGRKGILDLLPQKADNHEELVLQILRLGLFSYIARQTALDLLDLARLD